MRRCPRYINPAFITLAFTFPALVSARPVISPALRGLDSESAPLIRQVSSEIPGKGTCVDLFLQGTVDEAALLERGVLIGSRLPNGIMTAKVPLGNLDRLMTVPGLERISAAHRLHLNTDLSVDATSASPVYWNSVPPNFTGNAGAGVIVGIVDTGIDWTHGDFKNPDGSTRILYLWDQNDAIGPNPAGFPTGTEWTEADINAGIPRQVDNVGHGSHVAGTAAGDGSATGNGQPADRFIGMAPRADIIFVASNFSTAGVVDAVSYIFQKATALGQNAVVNLSLGTQYGAHDGTETFDLAMSSLCGAGRIVVASAGNEGNQALHAEQLVPPGGPQTVTFTVPTYTARGGASNDIIIVDAYYPASANMSVTLTSPGPTPVVLGPIAKGASLNNAASLAGNLYVENGTTPSPGGDVNVYIQIYDSVSSRPPRIGNWTVTLTPVSTTASTEIDLWHADHQLGTLGVVPLFMTDVDEAELVGSPGSATQVIAVGAYTTKQVWPSIDNNNYSFQGSTGVGTVAGFSSPGPNRNNATKPDITAPGTAIVSVLASTVLAPAALKNPDGVHWTQQGTSMASPHVAGAVALLLAETPGLTPAQVKTRLAADALVDGFTGAVPNNLWGPGKLRMTAATSADNYVPDVLSRPVLLQNRPNPFNPTTRIGFTLPAPGHVTLRVYSLEGRLVRTLVDDPRAAGPNEAVWDGRADDGTPSASGVYFYRFESGSTVETRRLVLSK